jgi:hypothetical protein
LRTTKGELARIIARKGYGIKGTLGSRSIGSSFGNSRPVNDVERDSEVELEGPESLQIRCAGKVVVRFKFYRYRLADYSRAISEKALIDALQYAGAICGDSEKEILLKDEGQEKVATKEEERTEITLEYPEVDFDNLWEPRKRKDGR